MSDTVIIDSPENLSEADKLEIQALSGAGVSASPAFLFGDNTATIPALPPDLEATNYPPGYKSQTPTPDPAFPERVKQEFLIADTDGARQALEDSVVKPGQRLTSKRAVTLPSWASPSWVKASLEADAAEADAAELDSEKSRLPALLNQAITNQDLAAIQSIQGRMASIDLELFAARLEAQKAQATFYAVGAAEYAANQEQAESLLPDKQAAADAAAQELKDVTNERDECRTRAWDWRGYAKRSEIGIAEITAAERKRLTNAAIRGPRQYH